MEDLTLVLDWLFKVVACAIAFSMALVLGAFYGIPDAEPQAQPAPAAVVVKADEFPNLNMRLRYPDRYAEYRAGFLPEFRESFRQSCGKAPSAKMADEACHITFDVMVSYHFGSFSKEKLNEVMADSTHEEWVGFAMLDKTLQRVIEAALMPMILRRMENKTLYE